MPTPVSLTSWQKIGRALFSAQSGWKPKAAALLVLAYVVWPADVLPDVPFVGWLDDIGLGGVLVWYLLRVVDGQKKADHTE